MPILTEDQERQRVTWQYRCVARTRGNQTQLGAVLLAVLGQQRATYPRFQGQATITPEGIMLCDFYGRDMVYRPLAGVASVGELVGQFSEIADDLRLPDQDRIALFAAVKNWIGRDMRDGDKVLHFTIRKR